MMEVNGNAAGGGQQPPPSEVGGQSDGEQESARRAMHVAVMFGLGAIFMAMATVGVELWRVNASASGGDELAQSSSAGSLAGLLLFGILTFFFGLGALIALLRALGLHAPDHALGMPEGSIRAFMALALIMLFFLMAVFLYLDVSRTGTDRSFSNISTTAYETLLASGQVVEAYPATVVEPVAPTPSEEASDPPGDEEATDATSPEAETRWNVVVRTRRQSSAVAEDIARQLVTVLGTLIVAIASFYFGSSALGQATGNGTAATNAAPEVPPKPATAALAKDKTQEKDDEDGSTNDS